MSLLVTLRMSGSTTIYQKPMKSNIGTKTMQNEGLLFQSLCWAKTCGDIALQGILEEQHLKISSIDRQRPQGQGKVEKQSPMAE